MALTDHLTSVIARLARTIPRQSPREGRMARVARATLLAPVNRLVAMAVPFAGRAGFRVEALEQGYLRASMPLKGNRNHIGTMYAGALFTLAEVPGGVMAIFDFGSEYVPVLKGLNMTYLKPARTDVSVEFSLPARKLAELLAEADAAGKAEFTLRGELKDRGGDIVATSEALYQIRRKGGGRPAVASG